METLKNIESYKSPSVIGTTSVASLSNPLVKYGIEVISNDGSECEEVFDTVFIDEVATMFDKYVADGEEEVRILTYLFESANQYESVDSEVIYSYSIDEN
jgi:hypothetical protein